MNRALILVAGLMSVALVGCSSTSPRDLDGLKSKIADAESGDFGTVLTELHKAEDQLDKANKVSSDFKKNASPYEWRNVYEDEGHAAAEAAQQHRRRAEAALGRILQPLRDELADHEQRISYLESLHIEQGTAVPDSAVYFDTGSAVVKAPNMDAINRVVGFLHNYPLFSIMLTGYTDTVGTEASNKRLAARRNAAVKAALKKAGLPTHTVVSVAIGEAGGPDNTPMRDNRRVEIKLHPHGKYLGQ